MLSEKEYSYHENNSKELIISFSPHNSKGQFFKYKTFLNNQKSNILFLSDNKNSWFLEKNDGKRYKEFLKGYVEKFGKENTFFFGSSMGAYGALYHGIYFDSNVFASNPQIDAKVVFKHYRAEKGNFADSLKNNNVQLLPALRKLYTEKGNKTDAIIYFLFGNES
jgi:hypothetical protein